MADGIEALLGEQAGEVVVKTDRRNRFRLLAVKVDDDATALLRDFDGDADVEIGGVGAFGTLAPECGVSH